MIINSLILVAAAAMGYGLWIIRVAANDAQNAGYTYDDYVNYGLSESRLE